MTDEQIAIDTLPPILLGAFFFPVEDPVRIYLMDTQDERFFLPGNWTTT